MVGNIQSVMDGDIDNFIESYLRWRWQGGVAAPDEGEEDEEDI
jgi:hypothetical protein